MVTGGRGFTRELAREAARAGVELFSVSIDGDEQTHDRLRGVSGSYASAIGRLAAPGGRDGGQQPGQSLECLVLAARLRRHRARNLVSWLADSAHGPVGRAARARGDSTSPTICSRSFPVSRTKKHSTQPCDDAQPQQRRLLRSVRARPPQLVQERLSSLVRGGCDDPRRSIERRHQGLPFSAHGCVGRRQRARRSLP